MGSREQAVMGLESHALSTRVTKHFVTIYSKTCNNKNYFSDFLQNIGCGYSKEPSK